VFAQAFAILAITPALVAGVIAEEKQRKTLQYLLGSCLTSAEIVLGKLFSRMITAGVLLMIGLPIIALLGLIGGVDPVDVFLSFFGSASTLFLIGAFSVFVSLYSQRPREAVAAVYSAEILWLAGPFLVKSLLPWSRLPPGFVYDAVQTGCNWVGMTSPLFVVFSRPIWMGMSALTWYTTILWMIGSQIGVGAIFTLIAVARLRPVCRAEGSGQTRFGRAWLLTKRRLLPRPPCGSDPLMWKELFVARTGNLAKFVAFLAAVGTLGLLGYWTVEWARPVVEEIRKNGYWATTTSMAQQQFNMFLRTTCTFILVCWQLGAASFGSGALTSEREEDTWVSLISTPLTPLEIIRAKLAGALWATRALGAVWLTLVGIGAALGAIHPIGVFLGLIATATFVTFTATLGLFYSLRARSSARALSASIASMAVLNGLYLIVLVPFEFRSSIPFLGVTPFVSALSLVSYSNVMKEYPGRGDPWEFYDLALAGIFSVALYGTLTGLMAYDLVTDFDDIIDRPRTHGGRRRKRRAWSPVELTAGLGDIALDKIAAVDDKPGA
jgi:ABC-type transport system involved in multi-copper enzyme maturation permease subunit